MRGLRVLALSLLLLPGNAYAQQKPNIVLVLMDNLGWGEPGVYGGAEAGTGARCEKVVLVTEGDPEILSQFPWGMAG